jgi:hypothetical protein
MKIKLNRTGVWVIGSGKNQCVVIPGVNDLPMFHEHMSHPDVKAKIASKELEILESPKAEAKPGLKGMKEKEAMALIKETLSEETLKGWMAEETRPKIVKAIEDQLATFVPTKEE